MPADELSNILKSINKKFGEGVVAVGVDKGNREKFSFLL